MCGCVHFTHASPILSRGRFLVMTHPRYTPMDLRAHGQERQRVAFRRHLLEQPTYFRTGNLDVAIYLGGSRILVVDYISRGQFNFYIFNSTLGKLLKNWHYPRLLINSSLIISPKRQYRLGITLTLYCSFNPKIHKSNLQ